MTGLQTMLDEASLAPDSPAGAMRPDSDVSGDLARGHRALRRRRTRLAAGVTCGVALLGVAGTSVLSRSHDDVTSQVATNGGGSLLHTPAYDVPPAPAGWHLVGGDDFAVVYRADGDSSTALSSDFENALVIYLESESSPLDYGTAIDYDGRTFHVWTTGGPNSVSMAVRESGDSWLRMQYPTSAGWDEKTMIEFLDSVVVTKDAQGTRG